MRTVRVRLGFNLMIKERAVVTVDDTFDVFAQDPQRAVCDEPIMSVFGSLACRVAQVTEDAYVRYECRSRKRNSRAAIGNEQWTDQGRCLSLMCQRHAIMHV